MIPKTGRPITRTLKVGEAMRPVKISSAAVKKLVIKLASIVQIVVAVDVVNSFLKIFKALFGCRRGIRTPEPLACDYRPSKPARLTKPNPAI